MSAAHVDPPARAQSPYNLIPQLVAGPGTETAPKPPPASSPKSRPPSTRYDEHVRKTREQRRKTADADWARSEVEQGRPDPKLRALMYSAVLQRNLLQHAADGASKSAPTGLSQQQEYDRTLHHIIHYSVYDEHDDYMQSLQRKIASPANPTLGAELQDMLHRYRRGRLNETTFYTNVAALLFSRPHKGMPGCMEWMDLSEDERILVQSYVEDNIAMQMHPPDGLAMPGARTIEQQLASCHLQNTGRRRLPYFHSLAPADIEYGPRVGPLPRPVSSPVVQFLPSYQNRVTHCTVRQLADLFVQHRLPVLGLMQKPLDGQAFLELLRHKEAEYWCTSQPPVGFGLTLHMFRVQLPTWLRTYE